VLAARLTEDPDVTVCLIEAGPADTAEYLHIPGTTSRLLRSHLDWDYDTHNEPHCADRRIYLPRGRVLGGSSSINGMIYIRGNQFDYDSWGQSGWGYKELLPYFIRAEDNELGASEYHGAGGPLTVSENRSRNPMCEAFVRAAIEAGYPANDDFNGPGQDGFGFYQVTQRDGRRCSNAVAYLRPALGRPNLTVETDLQVHRVTFAEGRATGVAGRRLAEQVEIRAAREVILCAGAYNSPQLLMLSGIGPADQLSALGIPVLVDQPLVGENLQDHPQFWLIYGTSEPVSLLIMGEERYQRQFAEERSGPLASNGPESGGFIRTSADLPAPDLQYVCVPAMFDEGGLGFPTGHAISYGAFVLRPRSRGTVTLASDDPTVKPRIKHQYYADDTDLRTAVEGVRLGMELARQKALRPYTERPINAPRSDSDDDLREFVWRRSQSSFHPAGTCAMGTVVDTELRVLGVEGLRVVDASVMPIVVSGNTNAPTTAIAEKAADLIRQGAADPVAAEAAVM
jgi:choline dehydrogenase